MEQFFSLIGRFFFRQSCRGIERKVDNFLPASATNVCMVCIVVLKRLYGRSEIIGLNVRLYNFKNHTPPVTGDFRGQIIITYVHLYMKIYTYVKIQSQQLNQDSNIDWINLILCRVSDPDPAQAKTPDPDPKS